MNSQVYNSFEIDTVTIKISMTEYHYFINRADLWFMAELSMGRNGKSGHLSIFTLKHLLMPLKCNFFRASIYTLYQIHW